MLLVFISCSIHAIAQTEYYYYDAYGKKTPITLNENKLLLSIPIDYDEISKRIRENVQSLYWTQDHIFDFIFITRADLEKLTSLDFWEEDSKSVIITPSYIKDDDRGEFYREVFVTPYVLIKLKKEEDIDLLTPYLEKYRLKIAWQSPWTPLAVHLSLTLDSEKAYWKSRMKCLKVENLQDHVQALPIQVTGIVTLTQSIALPFLRQRNHQSFMICMVVK